MNLMFLDECYSGPVRSDSTFISSMTAVILRADKYNSVRAGFYSILKPFIIPKENTINLMPPELHGRNLLRDEPDGDDRNKLNVFRQVVDLVIESKLDVYRVGYYITPEHKTTFKGDERGTSLCWFGISAVTQPVYENEQLIVIMDGFEKKTVEKMSLMIRGCDIMRSAERGAAISLKNTENIIGEVFYADSRYSVMIQIVDIVAYLRNVNDLSEEGRTFSSFKKKVLAEAKRLDSVMKYDEVVEFNKMRVNRLTGARTMV
ncbi:MAG: DUF3800 domain-containing protein [Nitrospira sp.]|nr:DUF3800 domain-containing protein [Nitrospira sp.]MDH4244295.1 DUF3800 domain-containing protein [Nitrospira sp.]MDH4357832.1 DUF3800 domain-containing protein [Nitrospira sp.]MDH5320746.1 DUF3800 domain-containing protein [Nitrospira sp.]